MTVLAALESVSLVIDSMRIRHSPDLAASGCAGERRTGPFPISSVRAKCKLGGTVHSIPFLHSAHHRDPGQDPQSLT